MKSGRVEAGMIIVWVFRYAFPFANPVHQSRLFGDKTMSDQEKKIFSQELNRDDQNGGLLFGPLRV